MPHWEQAWTCFASKCCYLILWMFISWLGRVGSLEGLQNELFQHRRPQYLTNPKKVIQPIISFIESKREQLFHFLLPSPCHRLPQKKNKDAGPDLFLFWFVTWTKPNAVKFLIMTLPTSTKLRWQHWSHHLFPFLFSTLFCSRRNTLRFLDGNGVAITHPYSSWSRKKGDTPVRYTSSTTRGKKNEITHMPHRRNYSPSPFGGFRRTLIGRLRRAYQGEKSITRIYRVFLG